MEIKIAPLQWRTFATDTRITDNVFNRDSAYGPYTLGDPNPTIRGNTYEDGTPIR